MNRLNALNKLQETNWDVIIIGGGATGLGIALDCTTRGLKTLLVEKNDFSSGTSSRSTKLIHGGVRYLKQLNFKLVYEAIKERKLLLNNAEGLSNTLPFVIPVYSTWEKYFLNFGLKIYELLSIGNNIGKTQLISKKQTIAMLPFVNQTNLKGGVVYFDGQFNDSQICVDLAIKATEKGATILNYCEVKNLIKADGKLIGIHCTDRINQTDYAINGKVIVNATGVFAESIIKMDNPSMEHLISPSQGIHIVIDAAFGSKEAALMRPIYVDDRVIFVIPWLGKIIVGTTDTKMDQIKEDPIALEEEVQFLITTFNQFSNKPISKADIKSVFCGLRPLVNPSHQSNTAGISREHTIIKNESGLISIFGGKWTTYRKMAETLTNVVIQQGHFENKPCITKTLSISNVANKKTLIASYIQKNPGLATLIHPNYHFTKADILFSINHEMAQNVDDILSRRTRLLFIDAKAAIDVAPLIISILAESLQKNKEWEEAQLKSFTKKAVSYLVH